MLQLLHLKIPYSWLLCKFGFETIYLLGGMLLQANDRPPNMRDSPVWNSVTHIRGLQLLGGPRIVSFGVRCGRKKRSSKPIRQPGAPSHPRIQCWTVLRIWVCGRREINAHFFPARRRHTEPNIESGGSGGIAVDSAVGPMSVFFARTGMRFSYPQLI